MDSSGVVHGFLDINSTFTTIDDPLATAGTHITGINNSGEIVGYYTDGTGNHGFIATTVNAAPVLSFIGPVINAAADTAWPVTVAGTAGETGTLVFTDSFGHNVSVNVNGDGRYSVNLSMLTDGSINSTLTLTDGSSVSGSPLTLVGAPLPSDKYVRLLASSTGNLGKVGTDAASVIDASQTSNITFKTGNGPDTIIAGPNDVVYAGTGHDTVIGANGATLYAGSGPETLYGAPGETIFGGERSGHVRV
jgi:hypothetical protein